MSRVSARSDLTSRKQLFYQQSHYPSQLEKWLASQQGPSLSPHSVQYKTRGMATVTKQNAIDRLESCRIQAVEIMKMYDDRGAAVSASRRSEAQERFRILKDNLKIEYKGTNQRQGVADSTSRAYSRVIQQAWARMSDVRSDSRPSRKVFSALSEFRSDLGLTITRLGESKDR